MLNGISLTQRSYAFEAVIKPNTNTVLCDETVDSDGTLDGVDNAKCKAPVGL